MYSNSFPVVPLVIGLASLILLGVLLKVGWALLRPPTSKVYARKLPRRASSTGREQQRSQQDAFMAQRAFDLSAPQSVALTWDQFAQPVQQPPKGGPFTDDLEVSNPSLRAWVKTHIY